MREDLDGRLRGLRACRDADAVIELGCDLADAGRPEDAEQCFRRAAELGDALGWVNLGKSAAARGRVEEAADASERGLGGGERDARVDPGLERKRGVEGKRGDFGGGALT